MRFRIQTIAGAAALAVAGLVVAAAPAMAAGQPTPITGSVTVITSISMSATSTAFTYGGSGYQDVAGTPTPFPSSGGTVTPDYGLTVESGDSAGYNIMSSTADFSGGGATYPAADSTAFFTGTAPMTTGPTQFGIAGSNAPVVAAQHTGVSAPAGDSYSVYDSTTPPASLQGGLLAMSTTIVDLAVAN